MDGCCPAHAERASAPAIAIAADANRVPMGIASPKTFLPADPWIGKHFWRVTLTGNAAIVTNS
jgi:hypothetical protein